MDKDQMTQLLNSVGMTTSSGGFNWANLMGNIIFGMIGFVAFNYGRKEKSSKPLVIGIALMAYTFFITNTVWMYVVGIALCAALYFWRD